MEEYESLKIDAKFFDLEIEKFLFKIDICPPSKAYEYIVKCMEIYFYAKEGIKAEQIYEKAAESSSTNAAGIKRVISRALFEAYRNNKCRYLNNTFKYDIIASDEYVSDTMVLAMLKEYLSRIFGNRTVIS